MKLQDFVGKNIRYDAKAIAADDELTRQIQGRLIDLGLLEPPVDGVFGPVSTFALQRFQTVLKTGETNYLGTVTAKRLIDAKKGDIPVAPLILKTLRDTVFKARPIDSSDLSAKEKQDIKGGAQYELVSYEVDRQHLRITLRKDSFQGSKIWYVFGPHVTVSQNGTQVYPKAKPKTVKLPVPYKSQLDNYYNPTGSCNVTSLAMCLQYLGARRKSNVGQFEDELYEYAINNGLSRHDPNDLAKIVRAYGCRDNFTTNASIDDVTDWLAGGNPVVVHGYFTSFGHIIVFVGYDESGFIVNDPYGEWFADGYDTSVSGEGLNYSYNLIRSTCMPDGSFWVHFISK